MKRSSLLTISIAVHVGAGVVLGAIQVHQGTIPLPIELANIKPPDPPKDDRPPPPPPDERPPPQRQNRAPKQEAPQEAAPEAAPGFGDVPDFGLALGGVGGPGIAVAVRPPPPPPPPPVVRQLAPPKDDGKRKGPVACTTPASKPKPLSVPRPEFPPEAQRSGRSGKVRVRLTVGESGEVIDAQILEGLGFGFDEVALAAARRARFEPALACGKATRSTFTVAMRFSGG